jgi:hypothetical protein
MTAPTPQPSGVRRLALIVVAMLVVIAVLAALAIWASHNG